MAEFSCRKRVGRAVDFSIADNFSGIDKRVHTNSLSDADCLSSREAA
jgi:hypothetical protein